MPEHARPTAMIAPGSLAGRVDAVVIGASAGGVDALLTLLPALSKDLGPPVFVVVHLPRERPSLLAQVFALRCAVPVLEAEDKMPIEAGTVYVAPPDYHLLLDRGPSITLSTDEPVNYSRPSIDALFESAADVYRARLAAIILTGANDDGAAGMAAVVQAGGVAIVQSPGTATASAMPTAALARTPVDHILPLDSIATLLKTLDGDVGKVARVTQDPQDVVKVLLVDDLPENLLALGALLRRDGIELLEARSGAEALELLLAHPVSLALVDVQMPEMDGFELAELMRGSERTRAVPIIFVTAGASDERRVFKGYESGAVDFLFKPIDPHILQSKVDVFVELAQQRLRLARELQEKTETLQLQEMFTAMLGHDLRGPLSAIVMGSILLERKAPDDATRRSAARTLASAKLMGHMIADMLDLARVRLAGGIPVRLQPVDLGVLFQQAVEQQRASAPDRTIALTTRGDLTGAWDGARLTQMASNLIGNAIQHGDAGREIVCDVDGTHQRELLLSISNGGEIPAEVLPHVFDPFRSRIAHRSRGDGLGLGLYIVDQIARAHGGTADVRSGVDGTTTFRIALPRDGGGDRPSTLPGSVPLGIQE